MESAFKSNARWNNWAVGGKKNDYSRDTVTRNRRIQTGSLSILHYRHVVWQLTAAINNRYSILAAVL